MKISKVTLEPQVNIKNIIGMVTNPFETPKIKKTPEDMPDANLHFLKQMHIKF